MKQYLESPGKHKIDIHFDFNHLDGGHNGWTKRVDF
jgi:hypothetical protein